MNQTLINYISKINFDKPQYHLNMKVFPLLTETKEGPVYLTLKQALVTNQLKVKETTQSGSVPELKVYNNGDIPVLLLDGEELVGAKQNRVINTSILLKEKSETVIPVSCTEQGRWSYDSEYFHDSDEVMASDIRAKKMASVSSNLEYDNSYASNQSEVWEQIQSKANQMNIHSRTMAMKDIYSSKTRDLEIFMDAFSYVDKQQGMLVCICGKVVGFDIVSSKAAYEEYHHKVLRSYAMEAMMNPEMEDNISTDNIAKEFLDKATECTEKKYESVGHGCDYRYEGKNIVGSCLFYSDTPIHTSFFRMGKQQESYPSFIRRRNYRTN